MFRVGSRNLVERPPRTRRGTENTNTPQRAGPAYAQRESPRLLQPGSPPACREIIGCGRGYEWVLQRAPGSASERDSGPALCQGLDTGHRRALHIPRILRRHYGVLDAGDFGQPGFWTQEPRKAAISPGQLQGFLRDNHTTFEALASQFVDLLGFHELGHLLTDNFGIDPQDLWLDEFLASYWSYAYIAERQPEWKRVFELLGRPLKIRPKNTSLEDFERLYADVDDLGWYHGMFEARIREEYPQLGLKFLSDLKREFPLTTAKPVYEGPVTGRMKPAEVLERLEKVAPGFKKWASGFSSGEPRAALAR
jgi:hypothetical protein